MQPAASGIRIPSAYTIEKTTEPGKRQNRAAARRPARSPHQPVASSCISTAAINPPIVETMTPAIVIDQIAECAVSNCSGCANA